MNYKNIIRPLGVTSQRFKCSAGAFGSFVTGAFNTILQQKTNDDNISAQKEINKQNIKNQWDMFRAQNSRQDYLNLNQDLIKRQSLQRAGLNLWSQFGGNPNVATNAISQPEQKTIPKVAPQMTSEFAQLLQNEPLVQAEVDKKKAETNLINKQAGVAAAEELFKKAQTWSIYQLTPEQRKNLEESNKKLIAETEKIDVDKELVQKTIDKTMEEIDAIRINNNLMMAQTPLILQKLATEIALMHSQGQLVDAQTLVAYKSLSVMSAQIQELISRAKLNEKQAQYVSNLAAKAFIDATFSPFEHLAGIGLTEAQTNEVKQSFENLKQQHDWVPFNNIVGAYTGVVGVAGNAMKGIVK